MVVYLVILPLLGALAAFLLPSDRGRPWIVAAAAVAHTALTMTAIATHTDRVLFLPWLRLDALGRLILPLI